MAQTVTPRKASRYKTAVTRRHMLINYDAESLSRVRPERKNLIIGSSGHPVIGTWKNWDSGPRASRWAGCRSYDFAVFRDAAKMATNSFASLMRWRVLLVL